MSLSQEKRATRMLNIIVNNPATETQRGNSDFAVSYAAQWRLEAYNRPNAAMSITVPSIASYHVVIPSDAASNTTPTRETVQATRLAPKFKTDVGATLHNGHSAGAQSTA